VTLEPRIRFRPFSHVPGTKCLLPGSWLIVQAFPTRIRILDFLQTSCVAEIEMEAAAAPFTVTQDLENGCVKVGRMALFATDNPTEWSFEKNIVTKSRERLHLGNHKKQQWPESAFRADMRELLPFWYWISQWIPPLERKSTLYEMPSLLSTVLEKEGLIKLFKAGFSDIFVPRLFDEGCHGYTLPVVTDTSIHPLLLLQESFALIRTLFFVESEGRLSFLQKLPSQFHCGCLASITTKKGHKISFEWTKHALRRLEITAVCDDTVHLCFQKDLKECRLNKAPFKNGSELSLVAGKNYFLDNFSR
jgi:hypothetical protein